MSKRDFGNIKSLLHFDFPYVNEPNEGLDDDTRLESWSKEGNLSISTTSPVFGYRCANFPDKDSYIIGTNMKGAFNLSPSGSYELEAFVKVSEAPEETVPVIETSAGDYRYYGGHTFKLIEEYATWAEAKAACEEMGGHLATSTSAGKNEFLCGFMEDWDENEAIWIGLTDEDEEGEFRWITGEELSYTNWEDGEPNDSEGKEDYAEIYPDGMWNDASGEEWATNRYVCEWDEELGGGNSSGSLKLGVNAELKLTVEAPTRRGAWP